MYTKPIIVLVSIVSCCVGQALQQGLMNQDSLRSEGVKAYKDALKLVDPKQQEESFAKLARTAHENSATDALVHLINTRYSEVAALSKQVVERASESNTRKVLGAVENSRDQALREYVARLVIRKPQMGTEAGGLPAATASASGYAAELLADQVSGEGSFNDQALIVSLLRQSPQEIGYWIALTALGFRTADEVDFAKEIYLNSNNAGWLRLVSASALARKDRQAAVFVISEFNAFLEEFGSQDGMELVSAKRALDVPPKSVPLISGVFQLILRLQR